MTYRIAINGFGRIGRNYLRVMLGQDLSNAGFQVVAINDLYDAATLAHLLEYDSTSGRLGTEVGYADDSLCVGWHTIPIFSERKPDALPWADLGVDLVIESTGKLRARDDAALHLKAGAGRVLISAPGKGVDATLVPGVNEDSYDPVKHQIVSAASCTTNCVAPLAKLLHNAFGIERGYLTTVHAYTNDQNVLDAPHKDARRARAAGVNIIPTSTGAAKALSCLSWRAGSTVWRYGCPSWTVRSATSRSSSASKSPRSRSTRSSRKPPRRDSRCTASSATPRRRSCRPTSSATRRPVSSTPH